LKQLFNSRIAKLESRLLLNRVISFSGYRSAVGTKTTEPSVSMRTTLLSLITITSLLLPCGAMLAHENQRWQTVTPKSERRTATANDDAPSITRKVNIESLGSVDLSREFTELNKHILRSRRISIDPGGSVAWHEHQQRPGVAYLVKGTLIEIRDDGSGVQSIQRHAGEAVFESKGMLHGWKNNSNQSATAIVVDVIPKPQP